MIETINLVWIIPLSAMAGGFVLMVLFLRGVALEMKARKPHENKGRAEDDRPAQE